MKISTRGRYALRMMLDLAMADPDRYITIKSIADRQQISGKYLEQIISVLNKANYVKSVRGTNGGYKLARSPEEYTVGMILRLIEGDLVPVSCMEDDPNECGRSETCATLEVWKKLGKAINDVVDGITLADLVGIQREKLAAKKLA